MAKGGYRREQEIARRLGLRAIPFSGARYERGREDAENDSILAQIKSSDVVLAIKVVDLWMLYKRAGRQGKIPVVVFDGLATENYPEQTWIAFPLNYLEEFYELKPTFKPETDEGN